MADDHGTKYKGALDDVAHILRVVLTSPLLTAHNAILVREALVIAESPLEERAAVAGCRSGHMHWSQRAVDRCDALGPPLNKVPGGGDGT